MFSAAIKLWRRRRGRGYECGIKILEPSWRYTSQSSLMYVSIQFPVLDAGNNLNASQGIDYYLPGYLCERTATPDRPTDWSSWQADAMKTQACRLRYVMSITFGSASVGWNIQHWEMPTRSPKYKAHSKWSMEVQTSTHYGVSGGWS